MMRSDRDVGWSAFWAVLLLHWDRGFLMEGSNPVSFPFYPECVHLRSSVDELHLLCVPGMGMILWGASPLYIFQECDKESTLISTSRRPGRVGDRSSERSRSANLRADGQKSHIRPNSWVSEHNITKPVWRKWGMVNAAVVQGRIMFLPGEICPTLRPPWVVALHVVMHEMIGQKSADGIVVDSC